MTTNISLTNSFNPYYPSQHDGGTAQPHSQQADGSLPTLNIQHELNKQLDARRTFVGTVTPLIREQIKRHLKDDALAAEFLLEPAMAATGDFEIEVEASYREVLSPLFERLDPHLKGGFLRQLLRSWFQECVKGPIALKETCPPDIDIFVHCPGRDLEDIQHYLEPLLFIALAQKLSIEKKHLFHCYKALAMVALSPRRVPITTGGRYTLTTISCRGAPHLEVILWAELARTEICLIDSLSLSLKTGVLKESHTALLRQVIEDNATYTLTVLKPETLDLLAVIRLISHLTCGGRINGDGIIRKILTEKMGHLDDDAQAIDLIKKLKRSWKNHHLHSERHLAAMFWNLYVTMPHKLRAIHALALESKEDLFFRKTSCLKELPRLLAASSIPIELIESDGSLWIRVIEQDIHWLLSVEEMSVSELLPLIKRIGKSCSLELLGRLFSEPELIQQLPLHAALLGQSDPKWHPYALKHLTKKQAAEAIIHAHSQTFPQLLRLLAGTPVSANCFASLIKKTMAISRERTVYAELIALADLAAHLSPADSLIHQSPCEWLIQYQPEFDKAITLYFTLFQKGFIAESCATTSFLLERALDKDDLPVARYFWERKPPLTRDETLLLKEQTARLALETGDELLAAYNNDFYLLLELALKLANERSITQELAALARITPSETKPSKANRQILEKAALISIKEKDPEAHIWIARCADAGVDLQTIIREKAFETMSATEMMDDPSFVYVKKSDAYRLLSSALLGGRENPPDAVFWRAYSEKYFTYAQSLNLLERLISKFSFETSSWIEEFFQPSQKIPFEIFSQLPRSLALALAPQFHLELEHIEWILPELKKNSSALHGILYPYRKSLGPSWTPTIADLTVTLLDSHQKEIAEAWFPYLFRWAEHLSCAEADKLLKLLAKFNCNHEFLLIASRVPFSDPRAVEEMMQKTKVSPQTGWKLLQRYEIKTESLQQKILPALIEEEWIPEAVKIVQDRLKSNLTKEWYDVGVSILESACKHDTQGYELTYFCEPLVGFHDPFQKSLPLFELISRIRNTHTQAYLSAVIANLNAHITDDIAPWHALMKRWCCEMIADPVNTASLEYAYFLSRNKMFDQDTKNELKLAIVRAYIDLAERDPSAETATIALEFIYRHTALIHSCEETYTSIAPKVVTLLCDCFFEYRQLKWCSTMTSYFTRQFFVREASVNGEFAEKTFDNKECALEFSKTLQNGTYSIITRSIALKNGKAAEQLLIASERQLARRRFDCELIAGLAEKLLSSAYECNESTGMRMCHARNILFSMADRYIEEHKSIIGVLHSLVFADIPSEDLDFYQEISKFRAQSFEGVCSKGVNLLLSPKIALQLVFYLSHEILVTSVPDSEVLKVLLSLCNRLFESSHPGHIAKAIRLYGLLCIKFRELRSLKTIREYFFKACASLEGAALPIHSPVTSDTTPVNAVNSQTYTFISQQFFDSELLKLAKPNAREKATIEDIAFQLLRTGINVSKRFIDHPTHPLLVNAITTTFFSVMHHGIANAKMHVYLEIAEEYHQSLLSQASKKGRVDELLIPFDFEHHAYPKTLNYRKPLRLSRSEHYQFRINLLRQSLENLKETGDHKSISALLKKCVDWGWFEKVCEGEEQMRSLQNRYIPSDDGCVSEVAFDVNAVIANAVDLRHMIKNEKAATKQMTLNERRKFILKLIDRFAHLIDEIDDPDILFSQLLDLCGEDPFLNKQFILTCAKKPMPESILIRFAECVNSLYGDSSYDAFILSVVKIFAQGADERKDPHALNILDKILSVHSGLFHANADAYESVASAIVSLACDTPFTYNNFIFFIDRFFNRKSVDNGFKMQFFNSLEACNSFVKTYPGPRMDLIRFSDSSNKVALMTAKQADIREKDLSLKQDLAIELISKTAAESEDSGEDRVAYIEYIIRNLIDHYPEYASRISTLIHLFALMPLNPLHLDQFHKTELIKRQIILHALSNGAVFTKTDLDKYGQLCCYLDLDHSLTSLADDEVFSSSLDLIWILMDLKHSGYIIKGISLFSKIFSSYPERITADIKKRYVDALMRALDRAPLPQWVNPSAANPDIEENFLYSEAYRQIEVLRKNSPEMEIVPAALLASGVKMVSRFKEHFLHGNLCRVISSSFFWYVHSGAMNNHWDGYFQAAEPFLHDVMDTDDIQVLYCASHTLHINPSSPSLPEPSACTLENVKPQHYTKILELMVRLLTHLNNKNEEEHLQTLLSHFVEWRLFDIIPEGNNKLRQIHYYFPIITLMEQEERFHQAYGNQRRRYGLELMDYFSRHSVRMNDPAAVFDRIAQLFKGDDFLLQQLMIACGKGHVPHAVRLKVADIVINHSSEDSWSSTSSRFWELAANWPDLVTLCEDASSKGDGESRYISGALSSYARESVSRKDKGALSNLYRALEHNVPRIHADDKAFYAIAHAIVTLLPLSSLSPEQVAFFIDTFLTRDREDAGYKAQVFDSLESCESFIKAYEGPHTVFSRASTSQGKTVLMTKSQMCKRSEDISFKTDLVRQITHAAAPEDAEQAYLHCIYVKAIIENLIVNYPEVSKEIPELILAFTTMQMNNSHINLYHHAEKIKRHLFTFATKNQLDFSESMDVLIQLRFYFLMDLPINLHNRSAIANQSFKVIWNLLNSSHNGYIRKAIILFDRLQILFPDLIQVKHRQRYFSKLIKALRTTTVLQWKQPDPDEKDPILTLLYSIAHKQLGSQTLPQDVNSTLACAMLQCGNAIMERFRSHPLALTLAISHSSAYINLIHNGSFNANWDLYFNLIKEYVEGVLETDDVHLIKVSTYALRFNPQEMEGGKPSRCDLSNVSPTHYQLRKEILIKVLTRLGELGLKEELTILMQQSVDWGVFNSLDDARRQLFLIKAYQLLSNHD